MKKITLSKRHYLAAVAGIAFSICLLAVITPSRHRMAEIYYGYRTQSALSSANKKLQDPLQTLGFTDIKKSKAECAYVAPPGSKIAKLQCNQQYTAFQVLPRDQAGKAKLMANVFKVNKLMDQNGWQIGGGSIDPWFQNAIDNLDSQPDNFNYIQTGNTFCIIDFVTAYSKQQPPAVGVTIRCTVPAKNIAGL